ncbi:MAG: hypothetical protein A2170_17415 [Deltaproteobacteria bacterium RBG_13_53_10]|nr:MAG: hypothetical protein A2170_17415 [Deltaproteobacteria bacterium RBG_13_53_10]
MERKCLCKKRPCRVCGKWFTPNPRLGYRQQTCGGMECQRKWHARKCAEWNRKNRAYFREIYLRGRLESFGSGPPAKSSSPGSSGRINDPPRRSSPLDLPQEVIQEVIEVKQFIIIEYIVRLLIRGVQEVIHTQLVDKQREIRRLPLSSISRGDSQNPP